MVDDYIHYMIGTYRNHVNGYGFNSGTRVWMVYSVYSIPYIFGAEKLGHVPWVAAGRHGSQAASLLKFTELRATFGHCNSPDVICAAKKDRILG